MTRAGDRAPDARLSDATGAPVRLFDSVPRAAFHAAGARWRGIAGARLAAIGDAIRAYRIVASGGCGGDGALIDSDGQVHRIYGDGLILVRPDGYLGYTGPGGGAGGLRSYLGRFFG